MELILLYLLIYRSLNILLLAQTQMAGRLLNNELEMTWKLTKTAGITQLSDGTSKLPLCGVRCLIITHVEHKKKTQLTQNFLSCKISPHCV